MRTLKLTMYCKCY